ncbi:MAG: Proline-tRNA ligase [Microgenomates group bacterium GW2011_GWF2_45_18]|nr:MAG: Proline-tRNA ligase [Microgenomates group bacterium GW2011_GWF1_44_10]KKU01427.1 MAG: Proline-tRNA ligase [Microgenomates group bacterium GW2011_GWF2_45_18]OGJ41503.1 MAG: prolyl-tRNA synthetase [Candidatus Pacebacteria bacterium RIFOXYB1_FULL_44_10]HAU98858.1 prolyl-tRNA synthetase [Candidatus Paceibacterota bacterium]HAX01184.1 prolyl-tRNA synthetase [Candidatus Paceibacterota bacterium]
MKYSQLFGRTRKSQKQYESKNQTLLQQAGFVDQVSAGVYAFLPLGLRVLNKISNIVREEMNAIGGQEVLLSALVPQELWEKTNRWNLDVAFKTELNNGGKFALGWSHEEVISTIAQQYIQSYKDLPFAPYQIQTKFRNEARAKSGIMRGREFLMKDMYSFHVDQTDLDAFYERAKDAYFRVFSRVGLGDRTFVTFASGGVFAKFSHEFQTLSDAGEDTIYLQRDKNIAINKEVLTDEVLAELGVRRDELEEVKAIEVGNIFKLGSRFSEGLDVKFLDEKGAQQFPVMGCYGIGPSRVMGTVVECLSDEKGMVWPKEIAPYAVHLIDIGEGARGQAEFVYESLKKRGVEVLWDDRDLRAGEKFADADLIGIPLRVVVSERNGKMLEVKERSEGEVRVIELEALSAFV